jgi:Spx/MgsR family transcriptional regulator
MIQVYGIPGCDKVKESLTWLKNHKVSFYFHDLKKESISAAKLNGWINKTHGNVLNKRSTTWKNLPAEMQEKMADAREAIKIMQEQPTIIKRPVIEFGNEVMTGFDADLFLKHFK